MGRNGVAQRRACLVAACGVWLCIAGCVDKTPQQAPRAVTTEIQSPAQEIVSLPTSRPAAVPEPKIIAGTERSTLLYPCKQARPETLSEAVQGLLGPQGTAQPSAALNTVIVADAPDTVNTVMKALQEMDHGSAQLLIEARVVEIKLDSDLETEVEHLLQMADSSGSSLRSGSLTLKTPGGSPQSDQGGNIHIRPWSSSSGQFDTFVRLLVTRGKAKILPPLILSFRRARRAASLPARKCPCKAPRLFRDR